MNPVVVISALQNSASTPDLKAAIDTLLLAENDEISSSRESFAALVDLLFKSSFPETVILLANALIAILTRNLAANDTVTSLPQVVNAFSNAIQHSTTTEAVESLCNALHKLLQDSKCIAKPGQWGFRVHPQGERIFGAPKFFEALKSLEKHATSDAAKSSLKTIQDLLQPEVGRYFSFELPLRNATTVQQMHAALQNLFKMNVNEAWDIGRKYLDIFIAKRELIGSNQESIDLVAQVISRSAHSVGVPAIEVYDLFANTLIPQTSASATLVSIFKALQVIVHHGEKTARDVFSTSKVRDLVVDHLRNSTEVVFYFLNELLTADNVKAQQVFGTPEFKKKLLSKFPEDPMSVSSIFAQEIESPEYKNVMAFLDQAIKKNNDKE